jgi:hypothetical protein
MLLPASRTVMLPGQPHTAMDTAPELFVRELLAFLAEPKSPEGSERTRSQDKALFA